MDSQLKKIFINTAVTGLILLIGGFFLYRFIIPGYFHPLAVINLFFIFIVSIAFKLQLIRVAKKNMNKFAGMFLVFLGIKFLLYLIYVLIIVILTEEKTIPIVSSFLVIYFIFLVEETLSSISFLKKNNDKK